MKAADGELTGRQVPEGDAQVVPQAVQESNALRERREAALAASTDDGGDDAGPPAKSAKKDEWVDYAASLGIDTEGKSIPELQEAVEAHQAENQ